MHQCICVSDDALDWPHQPLHQINGVDRLVHQHTSPIQFPGSTPVSTLVVCLRRHQGTRALPSTNRPNACSSISSCTLTGAGSKPGWLMTAIFIPVSCC